MLPASPDAWSGPRAPENRTVSRGTTYTTRKCSTPPPLGSFSQKQPPGRGSIERFFASCEYVCSGFHHEPTCPTNASYTLAAGALTFTSNFTRKPVGVTCGADCADVPASINRDTAPNKYRRVFPTPSITRPSRFPSVRYICRTARCCCTTHGDGMPFEQR